MPRCGHNNRWVKFFPARKGLLDRSWGTTTSRQTSPFIHTRFQSTRIYPFIFAPSSSYEELARVSAGLHVIPIISDSSTRPFLGVCAWLLWKFNEGLLDCPDSRSIRPGQGRNDGRSIVADGCVCSCIICLVASLAHCSYSWARWPWAPRDVRTAQTGGYAWWRITPSKPVKQRAMEMAIYHLLPNFIESYMEEVYVQDGRTAGMRINWLFLSFRNNMWKNNMEYDGKTVPTGSLNWINDSRSS